MTKSLRLLLLAAPLALTAQTAADLEQKFSDKISATLKTSGAPSVSVVVVKDGKVLFAKAFGKASLAPDRPATLETRYAVGSISKQFTAAALLLEQEAGKLSLDDKVAKYFPDLTRANDISIRQLLTHTWAMRTSRRRTISFRTGRTPPPHKPCWTAGRKNRSTSSRAQNISTAIRATCWPPPFSKRPRGSRW